MVLQIGADGRAILHHLDSGGLQQGRRPDAGKLKQLRRIDGATGEHDLASAERRFPPPGLDIVDADRLTALEENSGCLRHDLQAQIGPSHGRPQIGRGARFAPALAGGDLIEAHAFLCRAVEIVIVREPRLPGRLNIHVAKRVDLASGIADVKRAADGAIGVGPTLVVLGFLEIGQHVLPSPAGIALRRPVVEVFGLAANEDHGVDGA